MLFPDFGSILIVTRNKRLLALKRSVDGTQLSLETISIYEDEWDRLPQVTEDSIFATTDYTERESQRTAVLARVSSDPIDQRWLVESFAWGELFQYTINWYDLESHLTKRIFRYLEMAAIQSLASRFTEKDQPFEAGAFDEEYEDYALAIMHFVATWKGMPSFRPR